jgi:GntP family gluconate:H+ symporter
MIAFIIMGSMFLSSAVDFTGLPTTIAKFIDSYQLSAHGLLLVLTILFGILGCFLDGVSIVVLASSLLLPTVQAAGIDLIWFGVLLAVNMQTSFMHPPFGFALFYLRSVAPLKAYFDKPTQKTVEPVTTGQIYWGAVPFVIIQIIMVGLIIAFPGIVSSGLDKEETLNMEQVQNEMMNATQADADATAIHTPPTEGGEVPADDPMKLMQDAMEKDAAQKP